MEHDFESIIIEIINSTKFKSDLEFINCNYNNLKQENLIRNNILERINIYFESANIQLKAFAEHPRINGSRVDLSLIELNKNNEPYKIEFKFQFSGDANNMVNYWQVINKDFSVRLSDLFILTIANWNIEEKIKYDRNWGITSNLSKYISKNNDWKSNILKSFQNFENTKLTACEVININMPYPTEYYFFILRRL